MNITQATAMLWALSSVVAAITGLVTAIGVAIVGIRQRTAHFDIAQIRRQTNGVLTELIAQKGRAEATARFGAGLGNQQENAS